MIAAAGIDRRSARARMESAAAAGQPEDQRHQLSVARAIVRADTGSLSVPPLVCPFCKSGLEYEAGLSWIAPDTYAVDTGYCATCSRRFSGRARPVTTTRSRGRRVVPGLPRTDRICVGIGARGIGHVPLLIASGAGVGVSRRSPSSGFPAHRTDLRALTASFR